MGPLTAGPAGICRCLCAWGTLDGICLCPRVILLPLPEPVPRLWMMLGSNCSWVSVCLLGQNSELVRFVSRLVTLTEQLCPWSAPSLTPPFPLQSCAAFAGLSSKVPSIHSVCTRPQDPHLAVSVAPRWPRL